MIDQSWLTETETEILAAALDNYIGMWHKIHETTKDENMRTIARWRHHVAIDLRIQLREP